MNFLTVMLIIYLVGVILSFIILIIERQKVGKSELTSLSVVVSLGITSWIF